MLLFVQSRSTFDRLCMLWICYSFDFELFYFDCQRTRPTHIADLRKSLYFLALFYSTNFLWIKRHLWFFAVSLKTLQFNNLWMIKFSQAPLNLSEILPVEKKNHFYFQQILYSFNMNNSCLLFEFHRRLNIKCMFISSFNRPTDTKLIKKTDKKFGYFKFRSNR